MGVLKTLKSPPPLQQPALFMYLYGIAVAVKYLCVSVLSPRAFYIIFRMPCIMIRFHINFT